MKNSIFSLKNRGKRLRFERKTIGSETMPCGTPHNKNNCFKIFKPNIKQVSQSL